MTLPPLRERREDIPLLCAHFIEKLGPQHQPARCAPSATPRSARLMAYHWPGNVRELENVIEQALVFAEGERDRGVGAAGVPAGAGRRATSWRCRREMSLPEILDDLERQLILKAYRKANGVKTETARLLGIKTSALYYKLEKYGIS